MGFLLGIVIGVVAGYVLALYLSRNSSGGTSREVAAQVRAVHPDLAAIVESRPAVEPEKSGPGAVYQETVKAPDANEQLERLVPDADLRAFLFALRDWSPQYHEAESSYGNSLQTYMRRSSFGPDEFVRWPSNLKLRLADDESKVAPDFCFRGRLLVEIKGNIFTASETDRALGQIVRYLLAWKHKGPALLIVCGECRDLYRALMLTYVTIWRRDLRIPITVYFLRAEGTEQVPTSVDPAEWKERPLPSGAKESQ